MANQVSVPSRGLRYLNELGGIVYAYQKNSFRPLTGIKVSELYILCRVLIHIQHIALGVSKSAFPIVITYNIIP